MKFFSLFSVYLFTLSTQAVPSQFNFLTEESRFLEVTKCYKLTQVILDNYSPSGKLIDKKVAANDAVFTFNAITVVKKNPPGTGLQVPQRFYTLQPGHSRYYTIPPEKGQAACYLKQDPSTPKPPQPPNYFLLDDLKFICTYEGKECASRVANRGFRSKLRLQFLNSPNKEGASFCTDGNVFNRGVTKGEPFSMEAQELNSDQAQALIEQDLKQRLKALHTALKARFLKIPNASPVPNRQVDGLIEAFKPNDLRTPNNCRDLSPETNKIASKIERLLTENGQTQGLPTDSSDPSVK